MHRTAMAALLALLALTGCRCGGGTQVGGVELGFRASGEPVDFGTVLEGTAVRREVELISESRADTEVTVGTAPPFSAPTSLIVPAGGTVRVPVTFLARDTVSAGLLTLGAQGKSVDVPLRGEGVRPLDCNPSAECRMSRFDLASRSCVETDAEDGAPCTPKSRCLENGVCRAAECVGTTRSCDDQNLCTSDACSEDVGCVNTQVVCPPPQAACRVPACDPNTGCGDAPAADLTPCGSVDCTAANICLSGACLTIDETDGFPCSPKTPCRGQGTCQSQVCVRPPEEEMTPDYSIALPGVPVGAVDEPVLLAHRGNLFFTVCAPPGADGGAAADGGEDGGLAPDASVDGGVPDGGGPPGCVLLSYTGSGFRRFVTPLEEGAPRALVSVTDAGVLLRSDQSLALYTQSGGQARWRLPFGSLVSAPDAGGAVATRLAAPQVVTLESGDLWVAVDVFDEAAPDASVPFPSHRSTLVRVGVDGGVQTQVADAGAAALALSERGDLLLYGATGELSWLRELDGGLVTEPLSVVPGLQVLATASERALVGGRALVPLDGGASLAELPGASDAGTALFPLEPQSLLSRSAAYVFHERCEPAAASCAVEARTLNIKALASATGVPSWEGTLAFEGAENRLVEAAVVEPGAVAALLELTSAGQVLSNVQLWAQGRAAFVCPLASEGELAGAVFSQGYVYLLVQRQGVWRLEAYDLLGLPFSTRGWPQRFGVSGTRRAFP